MTSCFKSAEVSSCCKGDNRDEHVKDATPALLGGAKENKDLKNVYERENPFLKNH
jgi:hypothetical protein